MIRASNLGKLLTARSNNHVFSNFISPEVPSLPGQKLGNSLPYLFDEVFQLCCAKDEESGAIKRWLQCHNDGTRLCKDRSGALDMFEPPSLAHILQKIMKKGEE